MAIVRNDWKLELKEKVKKLSGNEARSVLCEIIDKIVSREAGNLQNPFAYLSKRDWDNIEKKIHGSIDT